MPDFFLTWVLLCASAFFAGAVNSVAGGGTLLTFSSLLAVLSPVAANATSTMALLPGSLAAGWGYRRQLAQSRDHLLRLWPSSFIGGFIGSLLVIRLPERIFANLVPWLLITASTLLLLQRPLSRWVGAHPHKAPTSGVLAAILIFQLLVGAYGGYFGAGIGILMLSSLAFVGITHIHQMNAVKNVLAATINGITAIIFILSGVIAWKYAIAMAGFAVAGGYTGACLAQKMPAGVVRAIVVAIGFGVAAYSWLGRR